MDRKIARVSGKLLNDMDILMSADKKNYINPRAKSPAKRYPKGKEKFTEWMKRDKALHRARKILQDAGM